MSIQSVAVYGLSREILAESLPDYADSRQGTAKAEAEVREFVRVIAKLASEIWREHYTPIIGAAQVEYMLEHFQSPEQMYADIMEGGYTYFAGLIEDGDLASPDGSPDGSRDDEVVGYCAIVPQDGYMLLSKLYILKEYRGQGIAKSFLAEAESFSRERYGLDTLRLTVNKYNSGSIAAYEKMGFVTIDAVKTDIGGGYYMDDYIMEKKLDGKL